jgi:uncharacterized protein (TIGR03435 family)
MLQNLLADRFKLVVHRETKDQPIYALIVAKGGPKLKPSEPDPPESPDAPSADDKPKKGEQVFGEGKQQVRISGNPTDGKGITIKGGAFGQANITMADGKIHIETPKMTMAALADTATTFAGRPVIDMTELKGNYQVALDLSVGEMLNVARNVGLPVPPNAGGGGGGGVGLSDASDPGGSSIFASMQQLGLKLDARKAPMPFLVVDHFEKTPTEN